MLLAIDTATAQISLALHDGHALIAESTWFSPNNHTVELAPSVRALIAQSNRSLDELTGLAVAIGPGSYSALRIGVAFAKAVASARKLPLVGISTLDILALAQCSYQSDLYPVAQAGRGRVIAARYGWDDASGRWMVTEKPANYEWGELLNAINANGAPAFITGEVNADAAALIQAARENETPVTLVDSGARLRRAGYLAQEAIARLSAADADRSVFDAAAVVPIYIKAAGA